MTVSEEKPVGTINGHLAQDRSVVEPRRASAINRWCSPRGAVKRIEVSNRVYIHVIDYLVRLGKHQDRRHQTGSKINCKHHIIHVRPERSYVQIPGFGIYTSWVSIGAVFVEGEAGEQELATLR